MIRKVVYYGDPVLRKRCGEVKEVNDEIRVLIQDMIETMDAYHGVGLAAPQIAVSLRIFVLRNSIINEKGEYSLSKEAYAYINPKITPMTHEEDEFGERCLSLPGLTVRIWRPRKIKVEALDASGKSFEETLEDYNARVRMHENDHLNGVLIPDRADPKTRRLLEPSLRALKKKYHSS